MNTVSPPAAPGAPKVNSRSDTGSAARIVRFIGVRLLLAIITLWLLSVIVFVGGQLLPGDVGRAILGPLADARAVAALNHQLGVDRPLLTQYAGWIGHFLRGDMGESYSYRAPVAPFIGDALLNSAKLGALAFIVVVPLGIAGGVYAALHEGRWIDRTISIAGLSATVVPEFVSSIVLILVFGIWLQWLPIEATFPPGSNVFVQLKHLILPVLPLVLVFFGYIARMARAGTVEALDADYTRTAILKGLPRRVVIMRHVLRNALLPTVTVAATQLGYMIGGLVVVETLFHYQGIGSLIYNAAKGKDFPMLEAGVLTVGVIYTAANLIADALYVVLNPRLRVRNAQ
jgi:peptide/nickel transport system permease protein